MEGLGGVFCGGVVGFCVCVVILRWEDGGKGGRGIGEGVCDEGEGEDLVVLCAISLMNWGEDMGTSCIEHGVMGALKEA